MKLTLTAKVCPWYVPLFCLNKTIQQSSWALFCFGLC